MGMSLLFLFLGLHDVEMLRSKITVSVPGEACDAMLIESCFLQDLNISISDR
jgi:hypothetical protein